MKPLNYWKDFYRQRLRTRESVMTKCCEHQTSEKADAATEPQPESLARDPVCGMSIDRRTASHRHEVADTTYYFCSDRCREKFAAEPDRYLNSTASSAASREATAPSTDVRRTEARRPVVHRRLWISAHPRNAVAFRLTVQMIDGTTNTQHNADGILPQLIDEADFKKMRLFDSYSTVTGRIEILSAQKPGPALVEQMS